MKENIKDGLKDEMTILQRSRAFPLRTNVVLISLLHYKKYGKLEVLSAVGKTNS